MSISSTSRLNNSSGFSPLIIIALAASAILGYQLFNRYFLLKEKRELTAMQDEVNVRANNLENAKIFVLGSGREHPDKDFLHKEYKSSHSEYYGPHNHSTNHSIDSSTVSNYLQPGQDLNLYYEQFPLEERVVIYWPLSLYHKEHKSNKILGRTRVNLSDVKPNDSIQIAHFKSLTQILHVAKSNNDPLPIGILHPNESILIICTKDILPKKQHPPVYDLLKSVSIDNKIHDVLMEIKAADGQSYLLISYYMPQYQTDDKKIVLIEKNEGETQKMTFQIDDLWKGVYLVKPQKMNRISD